MVPYLRAANVNDGVLDLADVKEMNFTPAEQAVFGLRHSDVLVTEGSGSLGAVGASAVWSSEIAGTVCFQNTLLRLRPRATTDPRFLAWWCQFAFVNGLFASIANGASIFHVSADRVRGLPMTYVTPRRQRAIADYLHAETCRIDALVAKKQRLLDVVQERLATAVRHLLASLEAPVMPLKRRWTVADCKHRTPSYIEAGYPVVSPGDATPGRLDLTRCHRFVDEADYLDLADSTRRPRRGDIIYSRNASIGIASYVDTDEPFCMGQDVCLISSRDQDQLFLAYVLNTIGLDQLAIEKIGSTFSRINVAQILELRVPCPSPQDQRSISRNLDASVATAKRVTDRLLRQIALLQEHRRALITAAVTGELALPGLTA